jgi:hypothetical protein
MHQHQHPQQQQPWPLQRQQQRHAPALAAPALSAADRAARLAEMQAAASTHDAAMRDRRTAADAAHAQEHALFVSERALVDANAPDDTPAGTASRSASGAVSGASAGAVLVEAAPQFALQMRRDAMFGGSDADAALASQDMMRQRHFGPGAHRQAHED